MIAIRTADKTDVALVAELLTELGHPNTREDIEQRWDEWSAVPHNHALIATDEHSDVIGLAIIGRTLSLYRPYPVGRLWALVIKPAYRGQGLGRNFVKKIEECLLSAGCGMIELTSNLIRADAHRFYEQIGYERSSYRFVKKLKG